jgi:hypothetical protein
MTQIDSITTTADAHVVTESDYQKLYEESQAENARMALVMTAARVATTPTAPGASTKAKVTAQRVRTLAGEVGFLNMSRAERLVSVGCDPSISDEFLSKVFGRGNNGTIGRDLHRTDPARYNVLREASLILNLFAK